MGREFIGECPVYNENPEFEILRGNWQLSTSNGSAGRLPAASISKSLLKATKSATSVTKSVIL
jgi:hypothetical protein